LFDKALDSYECTVRLRPDFADAWLNRGNVLHALMNLDDAVRSYDFAIGVNSNFYLAYYNRGVVLKELNRFKEAKDSYDNAIRLRPDFADAYCNRAVVLEELNCFQEAIENYDIAIRIKPDFANAKFNKSINLLLSGNLKEGFELYEFRWEKRDPVTKRNFDQPLWLGTENIEGKTILIHSEQGYGDTIQFSRYLEFMHMYGAKVLFEVPKPLYGLFKNFNAPCEVIQKGGPFPYFDYQCPLLSLPLVFKTELLNIPSVTPYFFSDPVQNKYWEFQLGKRIKPRIGIVWSGDAKHTKDHVRSMKLEELASKLPVNFEYISLQKEVREHDVASLKKYSIKHFGDQLHDFTDTASLIECMDLVISVDTSVAHLSASLGKETWILISFMPDFRWFLGRDDSPWYKSVSLYRQKNDRQWAPVLERLSANLLNTSFHK
jgi:tetratricopeptide (TPR) repeat protein